MVAAKTTAMADPHIYFFLFVFAVSQCNTQSSETEIEYPTTNSSRTTDLFSNEVTDSALSTLTPSETTKMTTQQLIVIDNYLTNSSPNRGNAHDDLEDEDDEDNLDNMDADCEYADNTSQHGPEAEAAVVKLETHNLLPFVDLKSNADNRPIFLVEPQNSYVVKNKPAVLQCRAANALQVYFKCNGVRQSHDQSEFVEPQAGVRIVECERAVTRDQVEEFFGQHRFRCDCFAWSARGQIRSRPAYVEVAYLKKQFAVSPRASSVPQYGRATLRCVPPAGAPPPRLAWLRDGAPLASDPNLQLAGDGVFVIAQATLQDMANYTCVAENVAGKRVSEPALLTVYVNGAWSSWSSWSECRCAGRPASGVKRSRACDSPAPLHGGAACSGAGVQRSQDCLPCQSAVPGRWSAWSEWSPCGADCRRVRRRACQAAPCAGRDAQGADCGGNACLQAAHRDIAVVSSTYLAMFCGLAVAVLFFTAIVVFTIRLLNKKHRGNPLFTKPQSVFRPEYFASSDKKAIPSRPDLTQRGGEADRAGAFYDASTHSRINADHLYDVPQLSNSYMCPLDYEPDVALPAESEPNGDKKLLCDSDRSESSCFMSSAGSTEDRPDDVSPSSSKYIAKNEPIASGAGTLVARDVTSAGARMHLEACGSSLFLPENAIQKYKQESFWMSISTDDRERPFLPEGMTQLSPIIKCGPDNITLQKPAIIQFPHCASLKNSNWVVTLLRLATRLDQAACQWTRIVTLGQETANAPFFLQIDCDKVFLLTDILGTFVLVGQSFSGYDVKLLKIAVFAPNATTRPNINYNLRVYIFEDTLCALYYCLENERKLGGVLLDNPKTLRFQDGCSDLCFNLEDVGLGWRTANGTSYQEIPFSHVWNSNLNSLHCSFSLEQTDSINNLEFNIVVYQKKCPSHRQVFAFRSNEEFRNCNSLSENNTRNSMIGRDIYFNITENPLHSKTLPDSRRSGVEGKYLSETRVSTVSDKGINTSDLDNFTTLRINKCDKRKLCAMLDTPAPRGNDWRMLAEELKIERCTEYFATKTSPTEHLLNLWECRHRNTSALADLATVFRHMDRCDAASVVENYLGPSWL